MRRMIRTAGLALAAGAALVGAAGAASADAGAQGLAAGSPGVLSGNLVQVPVHIPVNACGNMVNVIGLLNPAFGNTCVNADAPARHHGHQGW
ncbi:chaplin [Streptomyces sp. SPB074]|uniref:chaplin n=1 Tax=Streptomyces sp. (strain SPB074) TaxID=465543 RepID=UPI00017FE993|nr:chaplin [Streptomyces sp. SPB074]EDY42903.1 membrane protein [Streptomyces sp. SPB074]